MKLDAGSDDERVGLLGVQRERAVGLAQGGVVLFLLEEDFRA